MPAPFLAAVFVISGDHKDRPYELAEDGGMASSYFVRVATVDDIPLLVAYLHQLGVPVATLHATDDGRPVYQHLGFKPTNEMRLVMNGAFAGRR